MFPVAFPQSARASRTARPRSHERPRPSGCTAARRSAGRKFLSRQLVFEKHVVVWCQPHAGAHDVHQAGPLLTTRQFQSLGFTVYGSGFGISGLGRVAGRAATWAKSALTMGEPGGTRGALMKKESTDKMGWKHSKSPWPLRRICSQKQGGVYRRRVG